MARGLRDSGRRLFRVFGIRGLGLVTGILFNVLVARMLGPARTGTFLIVFGAASALALLSVLGQDEILTRRLAGGYPIRSAVLVSCAVSAASLLGLCLVGFPVGWLVLDANRRYLLLGALAVVVGMTALYLVTGVLRGIGRVEAFQAARSIGPTGLASLLLVMLDVNTAPGALLSYAAAIVLTAIVAFMFCFDRNDQAGASCRGHRQVDLSFRSTFFSGVSFGVFGVGGVTLRWVDVFLMGIWWSGPVVGIYGMAARVGALFSVFLNVAGNVAAPLLARNHAREDVTAVQAVAVSMARKTLLLAGPAVALTFLFAGPLLSLFGPEFSDGQGYLRILIGGQSVNLLTGITATVLAMTGAEHGLRSIQVGVLALAVLAGVLTIPEYGAVGASLVTAGVVAAQNIAAWVLIRRRLGIRVDVLGHM